MKDNETRDISTLDPKTIKVMLSIESMHRDMIKKFKYWYNDFKKSDWWVLRSIGVEVGAVCYYNKYFAIESFKITEEVCIVPICII